MRPVHSRRQLSKTKSDGNPGRAEEAKLLAEEEATDDAQRDRAQEGFERIAADRYACVEEGEQGHNDQDAPRMQAPLGLSERR